LTVKSGLVRNPRQESIEQVARPRCRLACELLGLLAKTPGIDAFLIELVAIGLHPIVQNLERDLGVELESHAPAHDVGLRANVVGSDDVRARRHLESIKVPLEPRPDAYELRVSRIDRDPANLGALSAVDASTESASQQLATKADAEHRAAGQMNLADQFHLPGDPRNLVLIWRELGSERDDHVVARDVETAICQVDADYVAVDLVVREPVEDAACGSSLFVLEDERTALGVGAASSR
jgi:hypothetical protein